MGKYELSNLRLHHALWMANKKWNARELVLLQAGFVCLVWGFHLSPHPVLWVYITWIWVSLVSLLCLWGWNTLWALVFCPIMLRWPSHPKFSSDLNLKEETQVSSRLWHQQSDHDCEEVGLSSSLVEKHLSAWDEVQTSMWEEQREDGFGPAALLWEWDLFRTGRSGKKDFLGSGLL